MSSASLVRKKREEILSITERYGAHDIRLFGSVARGEAMEEGDVDLLVRLDSGVTLLRQSAMVRELEALLGRSVDVVSERGLRPRVRERVLREAVPL